MEDEDATPEAFLPQLAARLRELGEDASRRLEELLKGHDPVELFAVTVISNLLHNPETLTEREIGTALVEAERLAYEAYPRFEQSQVAGETSTLPVTRSDAGRCNDALREIVRWSASQTLYEGRNDPDELDMLLTQVRHRAETVRGEAYPPQTERRIREVQGRFDRWFEARVGIAPTQACAAIAAIVKGHVDGYNLRAEPLVRQRMEESRSMWAAMKKEPEANLDDHARQILDRARNPRQMEMLTADWIYGQTVFEYIPTDPTGGDTPALTADEWEALVALVGMTPEHRATMTRPLDVRDRPLYVLPDGRALIADLSTTLEATWAAFERAARADTRFYARYQKVLSGWLEEQAVAALSAVFSEDNVFSTLDYPDPDGDENATTELDAAVRWGPFLILIEAKAKQFRLAGQLGDKGRLRTDLQRNVTDAFDQALRARRYVEASDAPVFVERGTGRELVIDKAALRRTYLMTVSAYELATLTTRLASLAPLDLFGDERDTFPYAVSEGDLGVLAEMLPEPEAFLHYLEQRTAMHAMALDVQADEIDLIGAYLETRFVDALDWGSLDADSVSLVGLNDDVDRWVRWKWVGDVQEPEVGLALPDGVADVLATLREGSDDERWVAFKMMGLPERALAATIGGLAAGRREPPGVGGSKRLLSLREDVMIVVIASNRLETAAKLRDRVQRRTQIERYRSRTPRALGLGILVYSDAAVNAAVWEEGEWIEDAEMEAHLATEQLSPAMAGSRTPGRNEPCFCGSGNKYKRCCGAKMGRRQ